MSLPYPNALTPEECLANVKFQLDNVSGWLTAVKGMPEDSGPLCAAMMKAGSLVAAAQKLHAKLEADYRAATKPKPKLSLQEVFKPEVVG